MLENDLIYGHVVSVIRPSQKIYDYKVECYISCLTDVFPTDWYPHFTSISNTHVLTLHKHISVNRSKTGNYNFIEPRAQRVQSRVKSAAPTLL